MWEKLISRSHDLIAHPSSIHVHIAITLNRYLILANPSNNYHSSVHCPILVCQWDIAGSKCYVYQHCQWDQEFGSQIKYQRSAININCV